MPDAPGSDMMIERRECRFVKKHERVAKKLRSLPGGGGRRALSAPAAVEEEMVPADQDPETEPEEFSLEQIPIDDALAIGDSATLNQATASLLSIPGGRREDPVQRVIMAGGFLRRR